MSDATPDAAPDTLNGWTHEPSVGELGLCDGAPPTDEARWSPQYAAEHDNM